MYMSKWVTLLYRRNHDNIASQLYSNKTLKNEKKLKKKKYSNLCEEKLSLKIQNQRYLTTKIDLINTTDED